MNPNTTSPPTQPRVVGAELADRAPIMPFGKYKGSPLPDLPPDYLLWVSLLQDLRQPLLGAILREMGRRIVERDQQAATAEREAVGK